MRFINNRVRKTYNFKDKEEARFGKKRLISRNDIMVRSSRPTRGDIYSLEDEETQSVYVKGNVKRPSVKKKLVKTNDLATKQFELLVNTSAKCKMPTNYSNDLYKHDKKTLKEERPKRFYWIVRPSGTHLILMDSNGKKLSQESYEWGLGVVKYNLKESKWDNSREIYYVNGTTIKPSRYGSAMEDLYKAMGKTVPPDEVHDIIFS